MTRLPPTDHAHYPSPEPTENGTSFQFRVYGQPTGAARLAEPLLRFILKRNFRHFCATLKGVLEDAAVRS